MNDIIKPRIVVWDVDDVLTPTSETFHAAALKTHPDAPHPIHWSDYQWGQHVGLDEGLETQKFLIAERIIETCEPYPYTDMALATTNQYGYKNVFLSARAWHPDPKTATTEWTARYVLDPYIHDMHFIKVDESKRDVLELLAEEYNIVAFVEDNPKHACAALDLVQQVYLVKRGWNSECAPARNMNFVNTALEAARLIAEI